MFEDLKLRGLGEEGIALATRIGRNIPNSTGVDLTEIHYQRYKDFLEKNGQNWEQRKPPSGEYNCAGHVWASRRTCIYEEGENVYRTILSDDGYRKTNEPRLDDLAVYIDKSIGILHIGRVVGFREGLGKEGPSIPWIVSKWNDLSGEVCHFATDHHYHGDGWLVTIEYWTDRPTKKVT